MSNNYVSWWLPIRNKGKIKFVRQVVVSLVSLLLSIVIGLLLIKALMTGELVRLISVNVISVVIIGAVVTGFIGLITGNVLWNKYDTIYKNTIDVIK